MKKIILFGIVAGLLVALAGTVMASGWSGYNYKARIFVGTTKQWCEQKPGLSVEWCLANGYAPYINDKITMKWNAEWDRGNAENWAKPPYDAWLNNEWNGMFPGGSGTTEHVKIKWVGTPCDGTNENWADGGYCIWGQFEAIQDFYGPGVPDVWAHAIPNGYGN